jgi:diguanylate cyclase
MEPFPNEARQHMRYRDNKEQSAEYLRLAVPLMSKQAAAMHPISYAVWYEYVSGLNPQLRAKIDEILGSGGLLDELATDALYRQHIAEMDEHTAKKVSASFQRVLADVSNSAAEAGQQASRFGTTLEQFSGNLSGSESASGLQLAAAHALRDTRSVQDAVGLLKSRLDDSQNEINQLREQVTRALQDALVDGLTGLSNRKGFDQALSACLSGSEPESQGPSLLMADIDHFKQVNDTYGHLLGDKVIRVVAQIIKANIKGKDIAARYGGEEFVILLPDTPVQGARVLAENIRSTIAGSRIRRVDSNETLEKVTISLGVASHRQSETGNDFVGRADAALYVSKAGGRNMVTVAP